MIWRNFLLRNHSSTLFWLFAKFFRQIKANSNSLQPWWSFLLIAKTVWVGSKILYFHVNSRYHIVHPTKLVKIGESSREMLHFDGKLVKNECPTLYNVTLIWHEDFQSHKKIQTQAILSSSYFVLQPFCPQAILSSCHSVRRYIVRRHYGSRDFVRTPWT